MKNKLIHILIWVYALFIGLFAFDTPVFSLGFLIHQLPFLILVAVNIVAMKKPKLGGYLFLFLSLSFTLFFKTYVDIIAFLLVSAPLLIFGILFLKKKIGSKI